MPSSLQLRPADIFGEVCIYPAGLAIAPFCLGAALLWAGMWQRFFAALRMTGRDARSGRA